MTFVSLALFGLLGCERNPTNSQGQAGTTTGSGWQDASHSTTTTDTIGAQTPTNTTDPNGTTMAATNPGARLGDPGAMDASSPQTSIVGTTSGDGGRLTTSYDGGRLTNALGSRTSGDGGR